LLPPVNRQHYNRILRSPEVDGVWKARKNGPSGFVVDSGKGDWIADDARNEAVNLLRELPAEAGATRVVPLAR
jgi:hypothetical protein